MKANFPSISLGTLPPIKLTTHPVPLDERRPSKNEKAPPKDAHPHFHKLVGKK